MNGPRAVVTGGAGFLGSHLCDRLLAAGWRVVCIDSLLTGDLRNLANVLEDRRFTFREGDLVPVLEVDGPVDAVIHLASPASPVDYQRHPIETLQAGGLGTMRAAELAVTKDATLLLASTSEVYGNPAVHPQPETYWGNVNPIGPRAVYDEAKRYAEAVAMAHHRVYGIRVKIARIFNTYGPRMRRHDGRAVPTFVDQALRGQALTVHGEGSQTRSLCYVDDLVDGLWRLLTSEVDGVPVNLGNPEEITVLELARTIVSLTGGRSEITFTERPVDDPEMRCPDISRAGSLLGWKPEVELRGGLRRTIEWAEAAWSA